MIGERGGGVPSPEEKSNPDPLDGILPVDAVTLLEGIDF